MTTNLSRERFEFRLIGETDNTSGFDCGHQYLNVFLRDEALQETKNDLSRTYLLWDTNLTNATLAGYFTLHADSIYLTRSNGAGTYLYPLVYISALARDVRYKGQKIGDLLLLEALTYTLEAANLIGIAGIHLDTTREGRLLYEAYGFDQHPEGGNKMLLPLADIRAIIAALQNKTE